MKHNELISLAKQKAINLHVNTQIRLTSDKKSYWVFNKDGVLFVGCLFVDCMMPPLFSNRKVYKMMKSNGEIIGELQKLFI